ncbi:MAG TPA: CPBP family glutamic-type intramembrane protease [Thermoanaerobaculia bacterium]|nr:CPBP family glutamic-type intramembrane protease [Thermoanaerobaculia bacterium]
MDSSSGRRWSGFDGFSWRALAAGIPLAIVYLLVYWIAATFVLLAFPDWTFKFTTRLPFALLVPLIVINAFVQEWVVTRFRVVFVSALVRSLWNAVLGPLAAISVFPVGLLLAALYRQRPNLWPLIVANTIANLVIFSMAP